MHNPAYAPWDLISWSAVDKFPNQGYVSGVDEEKNGRIEGNRLGAKTLTAIHAVENGSSDMENSCAKLNHNRRGVASVA